MNGLCLVDCFGLPFLLSTIYAYLSNLSHIPQQQPSNFRPGSLIGDHRMAEGFWDLGVVFRV